MLNELIELGLSHDEAKVYLTLLQLGGGYVSQIARRAEKQRATCYYTLSNLVEKGLATRIEKGKVLHYAPLPPATLVQLSQKRLETAHTILPELLSIQNTLTRKPKIQFFEGQSGVEAIFRETLSAENMIVGYTNLSLVLELFPEFFKKHMREKVKRGIKTRYLSPLPAKKDAVLKQLALKPAEKEFVEILFVSPEAFPFENEVVIYEHKVALMSLNKHEVFAVRIESESVAKTMHAIFDMSWLGATSFIAV